MNSVIDDNLCTGCMACYNACPYNAIEEAKDNEGFWKPNIIEQKCKKCNLCTNICPILKPKKNNTQFVKKYYSCWSKDINLRKNSSSGGLFSEIARIVLEENGFVFGVALNNNLIAEHIYIKDYEEMHKLQGSKYVQSKIGNIYQEVKNKLVENKLVLFSGTPCQVDGLNNFLKKKYTNLITIDLICHGVPSPMVFEDYKNFIQNKYKSRIEKILFRNKKYSWVFYNMKIIFKNKKEYIGKYYKDRWIRLFLNDYILNRACYQCNYANMNRKGDITLGDFWNYKRKLQHNGINNQLYGVSALIVNTKIGEKIINNLESRVHFQKENYDSIIRTNKSLRESFAKPKNRSKFWEDYKLLEFENLTEKWVKKERKVCSLVLSNFKNTLYLIWIIKLLRIPVRVINKIWRNRK